MKVTCSGCGKSYAVDDAKIPEDKTLSIPCPGCTAHIAVKRQKTPSHPDLPVRGEALLTKIVTESKALPPMPEVMAKAMAMLSDNNSGFNEIGAVIETDQALATRVLKISNSAYYALKVPVSTVKQAAAIMGVQAISDLITVVSTSKMLGKSLPGYGLSSRQIWEHSLACAYASRIIAEMKAPSLANDAFNAGLIHDSGLLMLDPFINMLKQPFGEAMAKEGSSFCTAEQELFGFTHAEVAGLFFETWKLPKVQTDAIASHHFPEEGAAPLAHIIHAGDAVAMRCMTDNHEDAQGVIGEITMNLLSLTDKELEEVGTKAAEAVESVTQSLG